MTPQTLFQNGQLAEAREAVTQQVRANPNDVECRTFLFELLCFEGELGRAEKQLDVIAQQNEQSEWGVQVYRNLLAAETVRRQVFEAGLRPEFLEDPAADVIAHWEGVSRWHVSPAEAAAQIAAADAQVGGPGTVGDDPFDLCQDCDDLVAPVFEMHVIRDYVWVPWSQIESLEVSPPERPRDLIWIPVRVTLRGGRQQRGYAPVLYYGSHQSDPSHQMGRATDWETDEGGITRGVGHRMVLAGDEAYPLIGMPPLDFTRTQ